MNKKILDCFLGFAVGDALGVPFEFQSRESLSQNRCTGMVGYRTHNQPPGTWSDDSSLTFCLAEALIQGFDLNSISQNFLRWFDDGFWTPRGDVFDIGFTTRRAIGRLKDSVPPELAGDTEEVSNGNGSLMRILPLLFYIENRSIDQRLNIVSRVSSITHRHPRSVLACFIYLEFARYILTGYNKLDAYFELTRALPEFIRANRTIGDEYDHFSRILSGKLERVDDSTIASSGYVVHTLEASLWTLLRSNSYVEVLLRAVNLGGDTDTTAAVAGGLAGLLYGSEAIPEEWIQTLVRAGDIEQLAIRLSESLENAGHTGLPAHTCGSNGAEGVGG